MSSVAEDRTSTEDEAGAGGKIVRRRRRFAASAGHPYIRREPTPGDESPGWISGIARTFVSGAGKLLSTVFGLPSQDDGSSSDSDDDEDSDYSADDSISSNKAAELNRNEAALESNKEHLICEPSTALKSESKCKIEQLLLQETFTRDECTELMKVIQSRVVDNPTMKEGEDKTEKELYRGYFGNDITVEGANQSLPLSGRSLEVYPYSTNSLSSLSPGVSALRAHTPSLCSTALLEAKKWLEEKKLQSSTSSQRGHGTHSPSKDMLPHVMEGSMGSPVEVAKSYMKSCPPWASPSLYYMEFKTPPSIGIHNYLEESSTSMACYSLPSTKELKRSSPCIGSLNSIDETRRVRLKFMDDMLEHNATEKVPSTQQMFKTKVDKEVQGVNLESAALPSSHSVEESTVCKSCQNVVHRLTNEKTGEAIFLDTNNQVSNRSIPEIEETVCLEEPMVLSEVENLGQEKDITASDPSVFGYKNHKVLEESQKTKEVVSVDSACHEPSVPEPISMEHEEAGLSVQNLNFEPVVVPLDATKRVQTCDVEDAVDSNSIISLRQQISSQSGNNMHAENSQDLHEPLSLEAAKCFSDSLLQDEGQLQNEANDPGNISDANGFVSHEASFPSALNTVLASEPNEETIRNSATSSDHGELTSFVPISNFELLSEPSTEALETNEADSVSDGLQNGSLKRGDDALQLQRQKKHGSRGGWRGKKVGSRRGRGKGK